MDQSDTIILPFENPSSSEVVLICDYSHFNFEIGYTFKKIKDTSNKIVFLGKIVLVEVTQEFMKPFYEIPEGWKTICKFQFMDMNPPLIISSLPKKTTWGDSESLLVFE